MRSKPYRLAYLVSHPIQYQAPLLRYLARQEEIDLTVFFLSDLTTREFADPGFARRLTWDVPLLEGYRHVFLPALLPSKRISCLEPFTRGVERHLAEGDFDALWVHGYAHHANLRAIEAARRLGIKVLLRGESLLAGRERGPLRRALLRTLFRRVDGFLAIGSLNREFYERHAVEPERIFSMPYAVDNGFFQARAEQAREGREELRRELGLEAGRPVILYASKFLRRKCPFDLLAAHAQLSCDGKKEPVPYLLFVGDGPEKVELERRARRNAWSSVRFLGFRGQTELPRFYDLCDVFVLPSAYEPWGLVVNEAMNAGRPVIASDRVGAAADLVLDGETGYRVPARAPSALADKLAAVLDTPRDAERMGRAALARVNEWSFESDYRGLREALEGVAA